MVSDAASSPKSPVEGVYKNNGYLMVSCNGGLNQMRAAMSFQLLDQGHICDMVAIARYMNVTLIVPELDKNSFWVASEFQDIFDVNHFIGSLRDEVWILKQLPPKLNNRPAYSLPPVSWFNISYYLHQKLRCRVNVHGLRFTSQVEETSRKLVRILREKCPFLVLHLRYEMDMLSFSGCSHGCISDVVEELNTIRETCHTVYAGKHVLIPEFPFKALAELRRDQRVPWHPPLLC
ncbi:hypothetical protein ACLB2K_005416 [Fragaria x ananassa]